MCNHDRTADRSVLFKTIRRRTIFFHHVLSPLCMCVCVCTCIRGGWAHIWERGWIDARRRVAGKSGHLSRTICPDARGDSNWPDIETYRLFLPFFLAISELNTGDYKDAQVIYVEIGIDFFFRKFWRIRSKLVLKEIVDESLLPVFCACISLFLEFCGINMGHNGWCVSVEIVGSIFLFLFF